MEVRLNTIENMLQTILEHLPRPQTLGPNDVRIAPFSARSALDLAHSHKSSNLRHDPP